MRVSQIIRRTARCALSHTHTHTLATTKRSSQRYIVGRSVVRLVCVLFSHSLSFTFRVSGFTRVRTRSCAFCNDFFFLSCSLIYLASDNFAAIKKNDLIRSKCLNNLFDLIGLLVSNRCTLVCNKFIVSDFLFLLLLLYASCVAVIWLLLPTTRSLLYPILRNLTVLLGVHGTCTQT